MSAFHSYQTNTNDSETLIRALHVESGGKFLPEYQLKPKKLTGYEGRKRQETAEIVIPREQVGALSNDIGFKRGADGKFEAVISEFDRENGFDQAWLERVQRRYTEETIRKRLRSEGYGQIEREEVKGEDGQIWVRLRAKTPQSQLPERMRIRGGTQ